MSKDLEEGSILLVGQQELSEKKISYSSIHEIGHGAFAKVYMAKCDNHPCAVKIFHEIFQEAGNQAVSKMLESFEKECNCLLDIKHPNIVQYLGLCQDPKTKHSVLLMELMDESLTQFLESSKEPLSCHTQLSLCHDVALALAYLHSLDIIHRDLTSNNVLLISEGTRAKVSDFGMSRVIDATKSKYATPFSLCPDQVVYMPPEALTERPVHSKNLDSFSYGVLAVQIMTRLFPDPGPRSKQEPSPLSPSGMVTVPVLETECRRNHIEMIDESNPLLPLALRCLALIPDDRPPASKLCQEVESLMTADMACASCAEAEVMQQKLEGEVVKLREQLCNHFNQTGIKHCSVCSDLKVVKNSLETENAYLKEQLKALKTKLSVRDNSGGLQVMAPQLSLHSLPHTLSLTNWKNGASAPLGLASVVFHTGILCSIGGHIYHFNVRKSCWSQLPKNNYSRDMNCIVVEQGQIIAFSQFGHYFTIQDGKWIYSTRCSTTYTSAQPKAVLYHAGLFILLYHSGTYEKGMMITRQLHSDPIVRSSYRPVISYASLSVCNDILYLVGASTTDGWTKKVYKCPLKEYLNSKESECSHVVLNEIAPLSLARSTCVTFHDYLLSVGGYRNMQACSDIQVYDDKRDRWLVLGHMPTPRYNCVVEVVDNQLVVIGGWLNQFEKSNAVEICTINL